MIVRSNLNVIFRIEKKFFLWVGTLLTWTGLQPLLVTRNRIRSLPLLIMMGESLFAIIAPGIFSAAYSDMSMTGKRDIGGIGRKDPYRAASMFPDSVQIGSWIVTRNTLVLVSSYSDSHESELFRRTHPSGNVPST